MVEPQIHGLGPRIMEDTEMKLGGVWSISGWFNCLYFITLLLDSGNGIFNELYSILRWVVSSRQRLKDEMPGRLKL